MSNNAESTTAALGTQIIDLRQSLDAHRDELRTVRESIDELRDAIEYRLANANDSAMECLALLSELIRTGREPLDADTVERRNFLDIRQRLAETIGAAQNGDSKEGTEEEQDSEDDTSPPMTEVAEHVRDARASLSHRSGVVESDPVLEIHDEEGIEPVEHDSLIDGAQPDSIGRHRQSRLFSEDSTAPANMPASLRTGRDSSDDRQDRTKVTPRREECELANKAGSGEIAEPASKEPYILIEFAEGDVAAFRLDGTWLACEETRTETIHDANSVLVAAENGTPWGLDTLESGRGHLQRHFPEIARQHRLLIGDPASPEQE